MNDFSRNGRCWEIHPAQSVIERYRTSWDASNRTTCEAHPLLDSRFVVPMVRHFGDERTILATLPKDAGAVLLERKGLGVWQTFLPSQAQIAPAVLPPLGIEELTSLMAELPGPCWVLNLLKQDRPYSCLRNGLPLGAEESPQARTMRIRIEGDFSSFWESRNKNLKKNLRRYFNRLDNEAVKSRVVTLRDKPEVIEALRRYGDLESRGWKGSSGTAVHRANVQGRFYEDVLSGFASAGRAAVHELYLEDRLAASRLCVENDDMVVILKTTHDEELRRYAPGRLLLYRLIEREFFEARHRVIEFYTNATPETLEWGTEDRFISHVSLYRHRLLQRSLRLIRRTRIALRDDASRRGRSSENGESRPALAPLGDGAGEHRWERVATFEGFSALEQEWNRCCELDGYRSIFTAHVWFENFIREIVLDHADLAIYLARSARGRVDAIFPMMTDRATPYVRTRTLRTLANYYSPVAKPIYAHPDPARRTELARSFLRHLLTVDRDWDTLDFTLLPEETSDFDVLMRALRELGMAHSSYSASVNWFQPIGAMTAEQYTAQLPSQVRSTIRRRLRRAEQRGEVVCRIYSNFADIEAHIDDYYKVYARSWKRPEPYPNFHRRLAETLATRNEILLGVIYFDGRPVAAQIWIIYQKVASILKLSYDKAYKGYSFGTILTHRLISYAIQERTVEAVDYLTGDDAYKRDWMSCHRERRGIVAFNRTLRGRLNALSEVVVKPALKSAIGRRTRDHDEAELARHAARESIEKVP